jgi:hypothetical protein
MRALPRKVWEALAGAALAVLDALESVEPEGATPAYGELEADTVRERLFRIERKLDQATVFFETHELEIFRRLLGGPYKSSSWFRSGLSTHEALQWKIDAELKRRGVPASCEDDSWALTGSTVQFALSPGCDALGRLLVRTDASRVDEPHVTVFCSGVTTAGSPTWICCWDSAGQLKSALRKRADEATKALRDTADALEMALVPVFAFEKEEKP